MYLCLGCSKMAPKMRRPLSHSDISVLFLYSLYLYSQVTITVVQKFDQFGALTSLPCLAIFGPFPVMNGGPKSKKKAHHHISYVWPACNSSRLEHKYGRNLRKMSKIGQNSMKNGHFLPLSCHEWQVWVRKKFSTYI